MVQDYTAVLRVEVGGSPLPDPLEALLTGGWVDASVNVPAAFGLTFSDPGGELPRRYPQLAVGSPVRLLPVTDGKQGKPLLTGEITAMEIDVDGGGRSLLVRGYDPGHRLLRNRRVEGYPNMTAADIVRKVASRASLRPGRIDPTPTVYDLATQPNITDWDFLSRLARENDVRLWFDEDGRLQFTGLPAASGAPSDTTPSSVSPYVVELGHNTLHGRVGVTAAGQVGTVDVLGWDARGKRALTGTASAARTPDIRADVTPADVSARFGEARLVGTAVPYTAQSQVDHAATALAHDAAGSFAELEVSVTGNPDLRPGQPIALKGAGFPFEGQYTVTGVRHVFSSGRRYLTRIGVSGRQFRSLYGLAADGAPAAPPLPGVVTALVSNVQDEEGMNRVKVKFPWLSDSYESDWCRVAQLGGYQGGGLVLPEVRDEVLVAFDRGSFEHPYVLAGLYNGQDRPTSVDGGPPVDRTRGRVNWRTFASRSGHRVELLDVASPRSTGVRVRTADGGQSLHLDQGGTTVTISSNGTVTIDGKGTVTVSAGADLELKSGGRVSIDGKAVTLHGQEVTVTADQALLLKGTLASMTTLGGPIELTADNLTALVPSMLLTGTVEVVGLFTADGVPYPPIP